jgi:hypothetical protein
VVSKLTVATATTTTETAARSHDSRPRATHRGSEQQIEKEKVAREQQVEKQKEDNGKAKQAMVLAAELPAAQTVRKAILGNSNDVGGKLVVQWLKANRLTRLLKRDDWPRYVETEPETYSSAGG